VGHPWIYSGAIENVSGQPRSGQVVQVHDADSHPIGFGHWSEGGAIRVRLLSWQPTAPNEAELVRARIADAWARRARLGLPNPETTAFRWVFGEGDQLPGLVIDRLGQGTVIQLGTEGWRRLESTIIDACNAVVTSEWLVVQVPDEAARIEGLEASTRLVKGNEERFATEAVMEHGLRFGIDPVGGQKTGYFADQRENRRRVGELAQGRTVLDAFCHGAGFGVTAAAAGAQRVTAIDSSARACRLAARNADQNQVELEVLQGDAMHWLRDRGPEQECDLIIVDPPKYAKSRSNLEDALKKYRKLNELAILAVPAGGHLVTCSCSGHVTVDDFLRMLAEAAYTAGRWLTVQEVHGQPGDHPIAAACPEGAYLKCVVAEVGGTR
jgi:23S rRNA (cytosine1962-C5)-methyltransferase